MRCSRNGGVAGLVVVALVGSAGAASAGGFAIREQSTEFQGASFAGNAAGFGLSSMYWNAAAAAAKTGPGIFTESHYSLILPDSEVTVDPAVTGNAGLDAIYNGASAHSGDIAEWAAVGSSYYSYQLTSNLFVALGVNSPFGLTTKPENLNYRGAVLGRTTHLLTVNANPTVAYRIAPGVSVGVGAQIQWGDGKLRFATATPNGPNTTFEGDGWAYGATAGILIQPNASTSIGLGWRSQLTQELEGRFDSFAPGFPPTVPVSFRAKTELDLPDIVTLSLRQDLSPRTRLLGTIEWSNWSRLERLVVSAGSTALAEIETNWSDGWFFSLGGEYDYSPSVTLRAGVAYEKSPVDSPEKRVLGIPDSDRVWLSGGLTYKYSERTSFDFAYTHIFLEDGDFKRHVPGSELLVPPTGFDLSGVVESSTDIISVSWKTRWGGAEPAYAPLK